MSMTKMCLDCRRDFKSYTVGDDICPDCERIRRDSPAPNEAEKEPHEIDVREMDGDYLAELAVQLRARACTLDCSRELHERSFEVLNEVKRRVAENARLTSKLAEMEKDKARLDWMEEHPLKSMVVVDGKKTKAKAYAIVSPLSLRDAIDCAALAEQKDP